ncbi:murein hydrolase activator EnvC family protein [Ferrimonas kyonanensis]|uniref:murein hydrolase activator EnvC family protein n=1 Tax=Ferrimonas kyonanensis TaxID=364763 RepID=UPI0003F6F8A8|nr:peptidoglycan DD-metalloendopeptidase family protein [Ferrimonas kyonanensis]
MMSGRTRLWPAIVMAGLLSVSAGASQEEIDQQQQQLQQLQKQIKSSQSALIKSKAGRDKASRALREDELAINKQAAAINANQGKLTQLNRQLTVLSGEQRQLETQYSQQQQQLADQIKASWIAGQGEVGQLLLNQNSADKQRLLTYYHYLNQARVEAMEAIASTKQALEDNHSQQLARKQQLEQTQQRLDDQQQQLKKQQQRRKQTLAKLDQQLKKESSRLNRLEVDSEVLAQAIEQALAALAAQPVSLDGLSKLKRKLPWPISGRVKQGFGNHRQGQLRWNGMLIDAKEGRNVEAVAPGQVVFADWLRGYGLVVVLDHGDDYLSLYGHAQSLLKEVGERVESGEVIALSGRSGGQLDSGLYFEIRHRGLAVDPAPYLKRR